ARTVDPGVVEDHVERAVRVDRDVDHLADARTVGHVDRDGDRAASARDDPLGDGSRGGLVEVGDDDSASFGGDRLAGSSTDPACAAGDDHDAVLHTSHGYVTPAPSGAGALSRTAHRPLLAGLRPAGWQATVQSSQTLLRPA